MRKTLVNSGWRWPRVGRAWASRTLWETLLGPGPVMVLRGTLRGSSSDVGGEMSRVMMVRRLWCVKRPKPNEFEYLENIDLDSGHSTSYSTIRLYIYTTVVTDKQTHIHISNTEHLIIPSPDKWNKWRQTSFVSTLRFQYECKHLTKTDNVTTTDRWQLTFLSTRKGIVPRHFVIT